MEYLPIIVGNVIYDVTFILLLLAQFGLGIKYNTREFMVGMICGLILEVVGHAGRIMLHDNPFDSAISSCRPSIYPPPLNSRPNTREKS